MPRPNPGEKRNAFVNRCVPVCMKEGLDQKAAVGKCEGMYDTYAGGQKPKTKIKGKKKSRGK